MNNKGFAISIVLYSMIILVVAILYLLLGIVKSRYNITNDFVGNVKDELNGTHYIPTEGVKTVNLFNLQSVNANNSYTEYGYIDNGVIYAKGNWLDGYIVSSYRHGYIYIFGFDNYLNYAGQTLTLSFDLTVIDNPQNVPSLVMYLSGANALDLTIASHVTKTFNYTVGANHLTELEIRLNGCTVEIRNLQIQVGSTDTSYEPYGYKIVKKLETQTATIYASGPMYTVVDVSDSIDYTNSQITHNIGVYQITGTESFTLSSSYFNNNIVGGYFILSGREGSTNVLCNLFNVEQTGSPSKDKELVWRGGSVGVAIDIKRTDQVRTIAALKSWLSAQYANGKPVIIYYQLSSPTVEDVTIVYTDN